MSSLAFLTATEYWKQSEAILADMSTTAMKLAAPEMPSIMRGSTKGLGLAINLLQHTREPTQVQLSARRD
jgi:hypothetical protein